MNDLQAIPSFEDTDSVNYSRLKEKTTNYLELVRRHALRLSQDARRGMEQLKRRMEEELADKQEQLERFESQLRAREKELSLKIATFDEKSKRLFTQAQARGHKDGFDQGFIKGEARGFEEGQERATRESEKKIKREVQRRLEEHGEGLIPALDSAVRQMCGMRSELLKQWEQNILQIAAALAYQTIGRELPQMKDVPLNLLRETLELSISSVALKIRMNPDDIECLRESIEQLLQETGTIARAEIVPDNKINPGGCLVETGQGIVDQRLETRLERIIDELGR